MTSEEFLEQADWRVRNLPEYVLSSVRASTRPGSGWDVTSIVFDKATESYTIKLKLTVFRAYQNWKSIFEYLNQLEAHREDWNMHISATKMLFSGTLDYCLSV